MFWVVHKREERGGEEKILMINDLTRGSSIIMLFQLDSFLPTNIRDTIHNLVQMAVFNNKSKTSTKCKTFLINVSLLLTPSEQHQQQHRQNIAIIMSEMAKMPFNGFFHVSQLFSFLFLFFNFIN